MRHSLLSAVAVPLLLAHAARAQQTIRVPQDQPTIEAAIAAAVDGDRIQLTQSSYTTGTAGLVLGKSIVIETVGTARAKLRYPNSTSTPWAASPGLTVTGFGAGSRIVLRNLVVGQLQLGAVATFTVLVP